MPGSCHLLAAAMAEEWRYADPNCAKQGSLVDPSLVVDPDRFIRRDAVGLVRGEANGVELWTTAESLPLQRPLGVSEERRGDRGRNVRVFPEERDVCEVPSQTKEGALTEIASAVACCSQGRGRHGRQGGHGCRGGHGGKHRHSGEQDGANEAMNSGEVLLKWKGAIPQQVMTVVDPYTVGTAGKTGGSIPARWRHVRQQVDGPPPCRVSSAPPLATKKGQYEPCLTRAQSRALRERSSRIQGEGQGQRHWRAVQLQ